MRHMRVTCLGCFLWSTKTHCQDLKELQRHFCRLRSGMCIRYSRSVPGINDPWYRIQPLSRSKAKKRTTGKWRWLERYEAGRSRCNEELSVTRTFGKPLDASLYRAQQNVIHRQGPNPQWHSRTAAVHQQGKVAATINHARRPFVLYSPATKPTVRHLARRAQALARNPCPDQSCSVILPLLRDARPCSRWRVNE